uniref:Si:dkey-4e7.3 n=1 Tax=Oryzias sinensis TaxID=183150 RepID=A0A8C7YA76_9TELE
MLHRLIGNSKLSIGVSVRLNGYVIVDILPCDRLATCLGRPLPSPTSGRDREKMNEHHQVSLVATGPLTNLALAVRLDPSLPSKLRGLYIMGGNTESRGNTRVCGEFNFIADPEAAYIVLKDYQCPTYLACWEFTCYNKLSWAWLAQDSHKARFMETIFRHCIQASKSKRFEKVFFAGTGLTSCDSYAMAAAVDDSFIIESDCYPVTVELT